MNTADTTMNDPSSITTKRSTTKLWRHSKKLDSVHDPAGGTARPSVATNHCSPLSVSRIATSSMSVPTRSFATLRYSCHNSPKNPVVIA